MISHALFVSSLSPPLQSIHSPSHVTQLWVGVLLSTQSFFVGGLDDPEAAKTSAFGAMGMFIVTFFASIFGIYYDSGRKAESIEETPEGYGQQLNVPGSAADYGAM